MGKVVPSDGGSSEAHSAAMPSPALTALSALLVLVVVVASAAALGPLERFTARLASGELRLPPQAYRLQDDGEHSQTLSRELVLATVNGLESCSCGHRCLHRPDCLGTAYRPRDGICLLSARRPLPERLEPADEPWLLTARRGVAFLDEPCERDEDCRLAVPWSECSAGLCVCRDVATRTAEDDCQPRGELLEAPGGRAADSTLLRTEQAADGDACRRLCSEEPLCMAAELFADVCRLFSGGVTSSDAAGNGSQTWSLRLEGPPGVLSDDQLITLGDTWFVNINGPPLDFRAATRFCAEHSGIVWPGGSEDTYRALVDAGLLPPDPASYWIGLDDLDHEGVFIRSDGRMMTADDMAWAGGQPDNYRGAEHCVLVWSSDHVLNDASCDLQFPFVCQALGVNVALGRPARLSSNMGTDPARGTDGRLDEPVRSRTSNHRQSWTVDLGGPHQIAGFLYVPPQNFGFGKGGTTVMVSSDPLRFDSDVAVPCRVFTEPFLRSWMARYYACDFPVQGRYLHVVRRVGVPVVLSELMVFGHPVYLD